MKKFFAIALAVAMFASMATVASAAETTILTTSVPAATYTLNIPADQEIPFGATSTNIGAVSITESSSFAAGKNLNVTLTYDAFTSEGVSTKIPFTIQYASSYASGVGGGEIEKITVPSGSAMTFKGKSDGTVDEYVQIYYKYSAGWEYYDANRLNVLVLSSDWGKALAGEYTATITFTAEVVVEE